MAKDWDSSLKLLVSNSPEDFATWVFEGAMLLSKNGSKGALKCMTF